MSKIEGLRQKKQALRESAHLQWQTLMGSPIREWPRNRWYRGSILATTNVASSVISSATEHVSAATSLGGSLALGAAVAAGFIAEKKGVFGLNHPDAQPSQPH